MEFVTKSLREAAPKLSIYFLYLSAQILVLASLLLVTADIIIHIILMILSIAFYFATAFKNPGIYRGQVEPNHEDLNNSEPVIREITEKSIERKWHSQKQCLPETNQSHAEQKANITIENGQKSATNGQETVERNQIKPCEPKIQGLDKKETRQQQMIQQQAHQNRAESKHTKNNIFNMGLAIFNFAFARGSKQLQSEEAPQNRGLDVNIDDNIIQPKAEEEAIKKQPEAAIQQKAVISNKQINQQKLTYVIDTQNVEKMQAQDRISVQINIKAAQSTQQNTIAETLTQIKRYCRICEIYQPLRVRHCHTCDRCMATFDHHCPWVANCIAQKNKIYFISYLFFQTAQLLAIIVQLAALLQQPAMGSSGSTDILLLGVVLLFVLAVVFLGFHFYLIANNVTTWQLLRWNKIQYLSIFDKTKIASPFSRGILQNIKIFWSYGTQNVAEDWSTKLSPDLTHCLVHIKPTARAQFEPMESDRRDLLVRK